MNVIYFGAACVLFASTAYVHSRRTGDAFRFDMLIVFALAGATSVAILGPRASLPACIVLASVVTCAATDASSGYVYNVVTYPGFIATLALSTVTGTVGAALLWSFVTFLGGIALYDATRGHGLGLGDVKLFTLVAAAFGPTVGGVIAGSFILGACVVGIGLMRKTLSMGQTVAFAPFIAVATIVTVPASGFFQ